MRFNRENEMEKDKKVVDQEDAMLQKSSISTEEEIKKTMAIITENLKVSPEVIAIARELDVKNVNSILEFGSKPAIEISKFADRILNSIKVSSIENSEVMLTELTKVMRQFDKEELEEKKEGFFSKLFSSGKKTMDRLLNKYRSLGSEIDKIYGKIDIYKNEMITTNKILEEMFAQNFKYYEELDRYVVACKMIIEEIEKEDLPYWEQKVKLGDQKNHIYIEEIQYSLEMLKQRAYDLEMAKMVAMQTAPQIRTIQKGNYKLIGKMHSAFIITIPVFKNGIIQAVTLKRQKLVAQSMEALDKATNELLLKNAENSKNQSIEIAKITSGPSVKIETLENTWKIIMEGIEETERIEVENKKLRDEGIEKIEKIKVEFINRQSL